MRSENGTAIEQMELCSLSNSPIYFSPVQQEKSLPLHRLASLPSELSFLSILFLETLGLNLLDSGKSSIQRRDRRGGPASASGTGLCNNSFSRARGAGPLDFSFFFFQSAGGREESRRLSVDVTSIHRFHHLLLYGIFFLLCSIQPHCTSQTILSTA